MTGRTTPRVLALDVGTSSARAVLFDERGRRAGPEGQRPYRAKATHDGGSELDPREVTDALFAAIDEALREDDTSVRAVGISCFWHSFLSEDVDGTPISPVYTWADERFEKDLLSLLPQLDVDAYERRTGCHLHPSFALCKAWGLRVRGEKIPRMGSMTTHLIRALFGEGAESLSMASASGLFDQSQEEWDQQVQGLLGLEASQFWPTRSGRVSFSLRPELKRRWPRLKEAVFFHPVGDGAAANLGTGDGRPDSVVLSIGTSGALRRLLPGPALDRSQGLFSYLLDHETSAVGGALANGGNLIAWLHETMRLDGFPETEGELARRRLGETGLTILPYLAGERSPDWFWDARGAFFGVTLGTTPLDFVQAAMESVALSFKDLLQRLEETGPVRRILASGGAIEASPFWQEILATVVGKPLVMAEEREGSARGAALFALQGLGEARWVDLPAEEGRTILPDTSLQKEVEALEGERADLLGRLRDRMGGGR